MNPSTIAALISALQPQDRLSSTHSGLGADRSFADALTKQMLALPTGDTSSRARFVARPDPASTGTRAQAAPGDARNPTRILAKQVSAPEVSARALVLPTVSDAQIPASEDSPVRSTPSRTQDGEEPSIAPAAIKEAALPGVAQEIALHAHDQAVIHARQIPADAAGRQDSLDQADAAVRKTGTGAIRAADAAPTMANVPHAAHADDAGSARTSQAGTSPDPLPSSLSFHPEARAPGFGGGLTMPARETPGAQDAPRRVTPPAAASSAVFSTVSAATRKHAASHSDAATTHHNTLNLSTTPGPNNTAADRQVSHEGVLAPAPVEHSMPVSSAPGNVFTLVATPVSATGPAIATPLHQPGWNTDLGRQVIILAQNLHNGTQTAELRLDPPELGPLRVSISLNEGMASALFVSSHASVRQAIESALPQLSQQLAQAGISLGDTHVGDHGQAGFAFNAKPDPQQKRDTGANDEPDSTTPDAQPASRAVIATNNLVDTFA